jgi:hypothetical protein
MLCVCVCVCVCVRVGGFIYIDIYFLSVGDVVEHAHERRRR